MKIEKLEIKTRRGWLKTLEDLPIYPCNEEVVYKINELIDAFNTIEERAMESVKKYQDFMDYCKEEVKKIDEERKNITKEIFKKEKEPELLPCPFCGVLPDISETLNSYHIKCIYSLCDFVVENACKFKSIKEAMEAWNKRV